MKACNICYKFKPIEAFYTHVGHKDGRHGTCIDCQMKRTFEWKYGINWEQYEKMFKDQDGRCLICNQLPNKTRGKRMLHVDHDHTTGEVRALLCNKCNQGMGLFNDSPELLRRAAEYIELFRRTNKKLQLVK